MATSLPPPPTHSPEGSYVWLDWYRQLAEYVNQGGVVLWSNIDFSGSSLADLQDKQHNYLTGIQGGTTGEHYHLTQAQWAALSAGPHNNLSGLQGGTAAQYYHLTSAQYTLVSNWTHNSLNSLQGGTAGQYYHLTSAEYASFQAGQIELQSKATDPVDADIPSGYAAIYKNTTTNTIKLWVNDGGTFKSVTLT